MIEDILGWFNPMRWIALAVLVGGLVAGYFGWEHHQRSIGEARGRAAVQAQWDAANAKQIIADAKQSKENADKSALARKLQQENDDAKAKQLEVARAAADRNARDAERVRKQSATAAELWSHTLRSSPTAAELAAASDTINVYADLFGRADRRAGELAAYSDAARAAGNKCVADYDALTVKP